MDTDISIFDEEYLRSTDLFYQIYLISPASILVGTMDNGRFIAMNDGFVRLSGYSREEILGKTIEELDLIPQSGDQTRIFQKLEKGEMVLWEEARIQRKNGELRNVIGSFLSVNVDGTGFFVEKLVDITRMRELQRQEVLEASDRMREQLGRDLHDDIGQRLSGLMHIARALELQLEHMAPRQAETAGLIRRELQATNEETRRLARGLTPVEIAQEGLQQALQHLCESVTTLYTVTCELEADDGIFVDPDVGEHLYRMAQEAVNNAVRHGKAGHIRLRLQESHRTVVLEIVDDGKGIEEGAMGMSEGIGLRTMRYRARAINGKFNIQPREEGGTIVRCLIPAQP